MGINKINNIHEIRNDKKHPIFEVTIKQGEEIVYQEKAVAGVLCMVETIDNVDENTLEVEGNCQKFMFGHPFYTLFAMDQLRIAMKKIALQAKAIVESFPSIAEAVRHLDNAKERNSYVRN